MADASTYNPTRRPLIPRSPGLRLSRTASRRRRILRIIGHSLLFCVAASSALAVLFIFYFITKDALPFFQSRGILEFFTSRIWRPTADPASFGALPIFVGSLLVTAGACLVAVPLGVLGAVCLSDMLPFWLRQLFKPIVEVLAAIPSVAYGFFALVVFAPLLQTRGGPMLSITWWCIAAPLATILIFALSDILASRGPEHRHALARLLVAGVLAVPAAAIVYFTGAALWSLNIASGANALNVSIILGIMALPTIMSVSEDALQAVGRELREGAYALGCTRAEALVRVIIPAASSGIVAAIILGVMRAIGETMVVWMASGNAAQIPEPWWNLLDPVRTLTATIAGDMGEADHVTGSDRYHVLWAMALALLVISFTLNLISERIISRSVRRSAG